MQIVFHMMMSHNSCRLSAFSYILFIFPSDRVISNDPYLSSQILSSVWSSLFLILSIGFFISFIVLFNSRISVWLFLQFNTVELLVLFLIILLIFLDLFFWFCYLSVFFCSSLSFFKTIISNSLGLSYAELTVCVGSQSSATVVPWWGMDSVYRSIFLPRGLWHDGSWLP